MPTNGKVTPEDVEAFKAAWATVPGVRQPRKWTDGRMRKLRTRLRELDWRRDYPAAIEKIKRIPGLRGENGRKWRATVDWFLRSEDIVCQLLEGKYDNWGVLHTPAPVDYARTVPSQEEADEAQSF
jgi:hypothetical protein